MNAAVLDAAAASPPDAGAAGGDAPSRRAALLRRMASEPYRFELFAALRLLEAVHGDKPRLGEAARPGDEPVRFAQEPSLAFAPAAIAAVATDAAVPRLVQRVFGFLGPNGPLPTHLTEYVRERAMHHGDPTAQRFLDLLLHRFGLLFYRAWARAQPVVSLDRASDSRVARHLGALSGLADAIHRDADALGHEPKLYFTPRLARSVRDADGLRAWVASYFGVAVRVEQNVGHWMPLDTAERSRLARHGQPALGRGVVLGARVWDVQHKFRIVLGPLDFDAYRRFLPGEPALARLKAMVRQYVGFEFAWDLRLVLAQVEVPRWRLGADLGVGQPGRTAWLGRRRSVANDLILAVEDLRDARPEPARRQAQGVEASRTR
jgi:type VI secretion system protein ImpH